MKGLKGSAGGFIFAGFPVTTMINLSACQGGIRQFVGIKSTLLIQYVSPSCDLIANTKQIKESRSGRVNLAYCISEAQCFLSYMTAEFGNRNYLTENTSQ
jgi:hypothetical protein